MTPTDHTLRTDVPGFSPEIRRGLEQLAQALDYAQDLECESWEFAVEIDRLVGLGLTTSDLRWMVKRGFLSHAREITLPGDADRRFEAPQQNLAFGKGTCFVLTEAGLTVRNRALSPWAEAIMPLPSTKAQSSIQAEAKLLEQPKEMPVSPAALHQAAIPNWDRETRTFLVGQHLIKRFRVPSPNQEAVLEAFQEEGWPASIDDPLSPLSDYDPKRRLRDTIKCLNLNQVTRLIRFRGDGTGQRVLWEMTPESSMHDDLAGERPLRRAA